MTEHVDVAVVGAGGGGLVAALTAASAGAETALFEAAGQVGGTCAYSTGLIWAPATSKLKALGISDSPEEGLAHIRRLSAGRHDDTLAQAYIADLAEVLDVLEERFDTPYEIVRGYPDYYSEFEGGKAEGRYAASPIFDTRSLPEGWAGRLVRSPIYQDLPTSWSEVQAWGGFGTVDRWDWQLLRHRVAEGWVGFGTATVGFLLRSALAHGTRIELESRLVALVPNGDGWILTFERAGRRQQVSANHVVLTTGAYDWNAKLHGLLNPHPVPVSVGIPTVTGDAMTMALSLGASFAVVSGQILVPSVHMPGETFHDQPLRRLFVREPAFPGGLIVNSKGERFSDESFYRDIVAGMTHFDAKDQTYPNMNAWFVFDRAWKDKYRLGSVPPRDVPGWLTRGKDVRDLAAAIDVPADRLERTISNFNEEAARGADSAYGRGTTLYGRNNGDADVTPNPCLRPLADELFAHPVELATVGGSAGLRFDAHARVLDWNDQPIPGLLCAGNIGAGLVEGLWYNSGIANGRAFAFGYRAGQTAALS